MAQAAIFKIEAGVLAFEIVGDTDDPAWQAPGGKTADQVTAADYTEYNCQVTSGALNASPNTTDQTTPATFCEAEVTTTQVGVTSYELAASILQDPHVVDGLSMFLFQYDTDLAYFALGLNAWGAPKAIGKCRIVAGAFGGDARTDLTADLTLPVETKPDIQFGTATAWTIVPGDGSANMPGTSPPATTATEVAGAAGTWGPAGAVPPATVADLIAGVPNAVTASPLTVWGTGSYVQTGTAGAAGQATWNGTAWVSGIGAMAAANGRAKAGATA